jgi:hypothetical protein
MEARTNRRMGSTSASPHPAILLLPAMGVPSTYYTHLVDHWSSQGICVTQVSLSPVGAGRKRGCGFIGGYAALLEERTPAPYEEARQAEE